MMNPSLEESKEICLIKEKINNEQLIKAGEIVEKSVNQVAGGPSSYKRENVWTLS